MGWKGIGVISGSWRARDRRDFCFRSRYFRFRPCGKPRAFRVNIRADSYLGPILPEMRAEGHTHGFGLGDNFRSGYFRFRIQQRQTVIVGGVSKLRVVQFISDSSHGPQNVPPYIITWYSAQIMTVIQSLEFFASPMYAQCRPILLVS